MDAPKRFPSVDKAARVAVAQCDSGPRGGRREGYAVVGVGRDFIVVPSPQVGRGDTVFAVVDETGEYRFPRGRSGSNVFTESRRR